jgi:hypothetical protein
MKFEKVKTGPKPSIDYDSIDSEDGMLITLKEKSHARRKKEAQRIMARIHTWGGRNGKKFACHSCSDKGELVGVLVHLKK